MFKKRNLNEKSVIFIFYRIKYTENFRTHVFL